MNVSIPTALLTDVQRLIRTTPVVLIGSGFSCGFGLPSMGRLGTHLAQNVGGHLKTPEAQSLWATSLAGVTADLEAGLNKIALAARGREEVVAAIRRETARIVTSDTRLAEEQIVSTANHHLLAPARLLRRLYDGAPQNADCISVITTNYDTIIELFCDLAELPIDTGFRGFRRRRVNIADIFQTKYERAVVTGPKGGARYDHKPIKTVRLLKPHGSIAWHATDAGPVEVLDAYIEVPRAIVVPGPTKYEDALVNTLFDAMRTEMNATIQRAPSLLCIGFGFNDVHLQGMIEARLAAGMPALILTKAVTPNINSALKKYPKLMAFYEHSDGSTIRIGDEEFTIDESVWQLDDFLKVFLE